MRVAPTCLRVARRLPHSAQTTSRSLSSTVPTLQAETAESSPTAGRVKTPRRENLRALISLYHQTPTFITPENLSSEIDKVFANRTTILDSAQYGFKDLKSQLNARRSLPKTGISGSVATTGAKRLSDQGWSDDRTVRGKMVKDALHGTVGGGAPDLETVEAVGEHDLGAKL